MEPLKYSDIEFPVEYVVAGWTLLAIGVIQLPIWFIYAFAHNTKTTSVCSAIGKTFKPTENWGPCDPQMLVEWLKYKEDGKQKFRLAARNANHSAWKRKLYIAFGKY